MIGLVDTQGSVLRPQPRGWGIATPSELLLLVAISNRSPIPTISTLKELYPNALTGGGLVFSPLGESWRGALGSCRGASTVIVFLPA